MDTEDRDGCFTFKTGQLVSSRVEAEVSLLLQLVLNPIFDSNLSRGMQLKVFIF